MVCLSKVHLIFLMAYKVTEEDLTTESEMDKLYRNSHPCNIHVFVQASYVVSTILLLFPGIKIIHLDTAWVNQFRFGAKICLIVMMYTDINL